MFVRNGCPRGWRFLMLAALLATLIGYPSGIASAQYSNPQASLLYAPMAQSVRDLPVPAPPQVSEGESRYFAQTGHFLRGIFLEYWETHGALPILGLPITEALVEDGLTVQYLERARLEWHPEISRNPSRQVLLTRLGAISTESRGLFFDRLQAGSNTPTSFFFNETGHNLSNAFLTYWQRNGGLAVFGYPISEEIVERNQADRREYTVQYFERNRFEWHPERNAANNVQLGLLGVEQARVTGLNPMSRVLLPGPFNGSDEDLTQSPALEGLVEDGLLEPVRVLGRTPQFKWVPALIIEYNIRVEFEEIDEEDVGGAFIYIRRGSGPPTYRIIVPEAQRGASVESLASVLAHEATHAYDAVRGALDVRSDCSVEAEVRAFMNGLAAWVLLKGEDALARSYEPGTFDSVVNRSLRSFNSGRGNLVFDFNLGGGREHIRRAYGPDCGS